MRVRWNKQWVAALFLGLLGMRQLPAQQGGPGLSADQQLLLNSQREIVEHSIYRLQTADVVSGALGALKRELGERHSEFFPEQVPQKPGQALARFMEVIRALAASSAGKNDGFTVTGLIERSLGAYCRSLDPYSDYIESGTARKLEELSDPSYIGVGVTFRKVAGKFYCRPFEGAPADRSGMLEEDELLAINGDAVAAMSLVEVASRVSGPAETKVVLRVRHKNGQAEDLEVLREKVNSASIEVNETRNGVHIIIRRIDDEGYEALRNLVRAMRPQRSVILDLRGCGGGDLGISVAIAELFLPVDALIVRLETVAGKESLYSRNKAPYAAKNLLLLQDKFTASGAELIIAALQAHPGLSVETRGEKSFGKGLLQRQIQVSRGGILEITEARMFGPRGESWDGRGLHPSSSAPVDAPF
jgi:carboxyl-terminal processing protease